MENSFTLDIIAKLNKALSKKAINGDLKSLDNSMYVRVMAKLSKTLSRKELNKQLKELDNLYVNIGTKVKADKKTIEQNIRMLQKSVADIEIGLKASKLQQEKLNAEIEAIRKNAQRKINSEPLEFNLQVKKDKLVSDIEYLGKRYSKLFSSDSARKKYEIIMQNALSVSNKTQLADTRAELAAFTSELKANGLAAKSAGDRWRDLTARAKDLFSAATIIRVVFEQLRNSVKTTIELDKAYTDLIKVQEDLTRNDYSDYLDKCNKKAQELATTQKALIESASEFSKSGYGLDISDKLTEKSTILSNVGEMSASDSAKAIISGVQAYDEVGGYTDVVEKATALIDRYNELGNTASITTAELAKGVQSVGSVFADANTSVDEFLSLLSAGNRQYQDADALALALRTSALRIRGASVELEEAGEDIEGVMSTLDNQKAIKALTGVDILEKDQETIRSIYDIFQDISKVYKDMSDTDQSALLEILAGKHRASAISATLNNMTEAEELLKKSLNADGSAQKEYDIYMESAEAHLNQFKAKLTEIYTELMNGKAVSFISDVGTALLDIVNKTDIIRHALIAIGTIKIGKGISTIGGVIAATVKQMNTLGSAIQQVKNLPLDKALRKDALDDIGESTKNLTEKNLKLLLSQKNLEESDIIAILTMHDLTEEQAKEKLVKMGLTAATDTNTASNIKNASSAKIAKGAFHGLANSIKMTWMAMSTLEKFSLILTAISVAWTVYSAATDSANQKMKEARQKAVETANASAEEADALQEAYTRYKQLASIQDRTESQENDFKSAVEDVTKALGDKKDALKGVKEGTEEYSKALENVTKEELKRAYGDAKVAKNAAEKELRSTDLNGWDEIDPDNHFKTSRIMISPDALSKILPSVSDIFEKTGLDSYLTDENTLQFGISTDASTAELIEYLTVLEKTVEEMKQYEDEDLTKTGIYDVLSYALSQTSEIKNEYIKQQYSQLKTQYEAHNGAPETAEEYENMKSYILEASDAGYEYQQILEGMLDADYSNLINGLSEAADKQKELNDAVSYSDRFNELWNSDSFKDAKKDLIKLAKEAGITEGDIRSLAKENEELAHLLNETGMSSQFAAACFTKVASGADGFSVITDDLLELDRALHGMDESLQAVASSKSVYDKAMEQDDYNAEFTSYQEAYKSAMEMFENGEYGRHLYSAMEYLLGDDSYTMSIEEMYNAVKNLKSIFGEKSTNGLEFLDKLYEKKDILEGTESSIRRLSDGTYDWDIDPKDFEKIADSLGMTTEGVTACVNALGMFGDFHSYDLEEVEKALKRISFTAEESSESLLSLQGVESMLSDLGYSGREAHNILEDIKGMEGIKLLDFDTEDEEGLKTLVSQLKELKIIEIGENGINVDSLITNLKNKFHMAYDDIGAFIQNLEGSFNFTDAEGKVISLQDALGKVEQAETSATKDEINGIGDAAKNVSGEVDTCTDNVRVLNGMKLDGISSEFRNLGRNISNASGEAVSFLQNAYGNSPNPPVFLNQNSGNVPDQTGFLKRKPFGNAHASGSVGIRKDETALINELGSETIIDPDTGTYEVVQGGAQFRKLKKGQIVLNHRQTEALQKNGRISSFGKMMYNGNAQLAGNAYAYGTVSGKNPATKKKWEGRKSDKSDKSSKDNTQTFDWIETAVERLNAALDQLKDKADDTYSSWTSRNENLRNAIVSTRQSIDLQAQAYQRYMAQAESVSLPESWKNLVRNGAVDISMISDEDLSENIKEYQTWYDKAQDCLKTQRELNNSLNELESHKFTNLQTEYESLTELMEAQKTLLENQITVLSNGVDYDSLRNEQNHILTNLRNERSILEATLNGLSIERGTEQWNNLQSVVTKTSQSIQEAEKSLREINRMQFDNLKEFYELSISLMEKQKDNAQNRITLLSGSGDYESLKRQQQNIISGYDEELKKLTALKNSDVFSGMSYENRMGVLSDIEDITGSLDEARNALKEISKLRFDNIKETLEFEKSSLEHRIKLDEEKIRLAESMGLFADTRYHTDKKRLTEQELSKTRKKIQQLEIVRDASGYEIGTSEWNSMTSEIMSLREQELSLTTQLEEVKNAIRDLDWEVFDHLAESVNDLTGESDFLTDLMEYGKLIDDKGKFTDEGNASLALNLVNADISKQQSESYFAEAAEIEKELKRGSGKEMLSRYNELIEKGRESLLAYKGSLKDAVSLIEERYQAELDALQKLIDKKKEQMQEEKNLYDYQKSIREKTDSIASLEKQKSAYTNDNSEETMARIQRIQLELKEAKEDLQEAEYEKYLSDSQDMLDKLAEDYENWMNIRLDNQEALIMEVAANVNNTGAEIQQTLRNIAEENGFKLSEYMGQILGSLNVLSERLVPGTGEEDISEPDYTDAKTKLDKALNLIENPEGYKIKDAHEALKEADAKYQQNTSGTEQAVASKRQEYMDNTGLLPANLNIKDAQIILKKALNLLPNDKGYTLADAGKALAIALNLTKGYKTGTSHVPKKGLYRTQEEGSEIILSKTRGMLTPLEQGDMVLTAEQSQRIFDFAKNPAAFMNTASAQTIPQNLVPVSGAVHNINNGSIHIELPDVKDYNDFRAKLVKDKTFENAMCTMVNNSIMGKSTISKRKYV